MNHRRPNPDELTPDDLFRPESGEAKAHYAETQTVAHPAAAQQQAVMAQPPSEPQAAATQFLPPIPAAPAPQPGFAAPYQAAPAPGGYPQQPDYGQPQQYQSQHQSQHQDYQQQGGFQGQYAGYEEEPPRSGPSMRTIAIGVVAACAVVGIGMGAMLSGGDSSASASPQSSGSAVAAASGGGQGGGAKPNQAQAQALSALLQNAASNRSAVIGAVEDIKGCNNVPQAQQTLTGAAQARASLVSQLGGLKVDQLPQGAALASALTRGWTASQQADSHYAAWAAASVNPCQKHHHPAKGGEHDAGDVQSGIASRAKAQASSLWNPIATADGLPTRSQSQL